MWRRRPANSRHSRPLVRLAPNGEVQTLVDGDGPADVLAPGEHAPVAVVALPLTRARQRLAAAPFALEDRLAGPLEDFHIALGRETTPGRSRVAHCTHVQMQDWLGRLADAGVTPHRIVSDANALPEPLAPAIWTVGVEDARALIRTQDGQAFVLSLDLFAFAWDAAGRPPLMQVGDPWPKDFPEPVIQTPWAPPNLADAVDLFQGRYRPTGGTSSTAIAQGLAILASAGVAHLLLLGLDVALLRREVNRQQAAAETLLSQFAPQIPGGEDPLATLESLLPRDSGEADRSSFLGDLARVSAIAAQIQPEVQFSAIAFDAEQGSLRLEIDAPDFAAIDLLQRAFEADQLTVSSEGARMGDGGAQAVLVLAGTPLESPP